MGLFSTLGSIAGSFFGGPTGGSIGGAIGGFLDADKAEDAAYGQREQEYIRQKEFAQMGIRWKAADAKAAGLHPLAAIGGVGSSYSPTIAMPAAPDYGSGASSEVLHQMGQNTARAQHATATATERRLEELAIRNAELRNSSLELQLAAQTASLLGQPRNPPAPSTVGAAIAPIGSIKTEPSVRVSASPRNSGVEAASTPFTKDYQLGHGLSVRLPSQGASEALEGLGAMQHIAGPVLLGVQAGREWLHGPENSKLPPAPAGSRWEWFPTRQAWSLVSAAPRGRTFRPSSTFGLYR